MAMFDFAIQHKIRHRHGAHVVRMLCFLAVQNWAMALDFRPIYSNSS